MSSGEWVSPAANWKETIGAFREAKAVKWRRASLRRPPGGALPGPAAAEAADHASSCSGADTSKCSSAREEAMLHASKERPPSEHVTQTKQKRRPAVPVHKRPTGATTGVLLSNIDAQPEGGRPPATPKGNTAAAASSAEPSAALTGSQGQISSSTLCDGLSAVPSSTVATTLADGRAQQDTTGTASTSPSSPVQMEMPLQPSSTVQELEA